MTKPVDAATPDRPRDAAPAPRLDGVDFVRGLVMVLMVLDHTRDYFTDASINPMDLSRGSVALFLTRWITHYCAPTFALLAGVGVRLASLRGLDRKALAWFLLTRGLWLVVLEQTVEKFGLLFQFVPNRLLGLVLWSIGGSFVLLAALVAARVPARVVGILGVLIVVGHNALDAVLAQGGGPWQWVVTLLLRPGEIEGPGGVSAFLMYALIPWFGVVATGFWLGGLYACDARTRRRWLMTLGTAAIALFVVLRATGAYGEPRPWNRSSDALASALDFLNCTKYPPSLLFLLMTLGPALLLLAAVDGGVGPLGRPLVVFGRVPLFYYLLQWYVIHGLAVLAAMVRGQPTDWLFVRSFPVEPPPSAIYSLPALYGWWIVVVLLLYPPCAWFARLKARRRDWKWLSYF